MVLDLDGCGGSFYFILFFPFFIVKNYLTSAFKMTTGPHKSSNHPIHQSALLCLASISAVYSLNPELGKYWQSIAEAMKSLESLGPCLLIHQSLNQ